MAAASAESTSTPAGWRIVAVVSTMNHDTACARMAPDTLSTRCEGMSSVSRFFSTTLELTRKIMYGEMVVPIVATSSEM